MRTVTAPLGPVTSTHSPHTLLPAYCESFIAATSRLEGLGSKLQLPLPSASYHVPSPLCFSDNAGAAPGFCFGNESSLEWHPDKVPKTTVVARIHRGAPTI